MKVILYFIFFYLFLLACNQGSNPRDLSVNETVASVEKGEVSTVENNTDISIEKMLIRRGFFTFQTNDVEKKHAEVIALIKKYEGYIANDNAYSTADRTTYNTDVKLPKENFDVFLEELSLGISHFDNKQITVEDVTEEFVDIEARLKTKKDLEQRYSELLSQANSVSEILEIEKQLGQIRSEIESVEGRLKYLSQQVEYATLNLNYYEKTAVANRFGQQFVNGFKNGWNNLIWFFVGLINIWPFIILFGILIYLTIRWRYRKASTIKENKK